MATAYSEAGDIVFARVVPMDGESIIVGSAPWRIPAGESFDVGVLRVHLAETGGRFGDSELRQFDRDLRQHFFAAVRALCEEPQPIETGAQTRAGRLWRRTRKLQRRPEKERRIRRAMGGHVPAFLRPLATD